MPRELGLAKGIFAGARAAAGAACGAVGVPLGAGAAACGAAVEALGAGACDHAAPDAHSETAPAKIKPAAIRILFPLINPVPGLGFSGFGHATSRLARY